MLIDEIKKAKLDALKSKDTDAKSICSVIINKYMMLSIEKREKALEVGDVDMVSVIQKTLKELQDEEEGYRSVGNLERVASIQNQKACIVKYLPKMMDESEIRAEIDKLEDKSIPSVMKHFKTNFHGKVEMGLVSQIAKTL